MLKIKDNVKINNLVKYGFNILISDEEYAEQIAKLVDGHVVKVNKTNGIVLTGIVLENDPNVIAPAIYIDDLFERNYPVEQVADKILKLNLKYIILLIKQQKIYYN